MDTSNQLDTTRAKHLRAINLGEAFHLRTSPSEKHVLIRLLQTLTIEDSILKPLTPIHRKGDPQFGSVGCGKTELQSIMLRGPRPQSGPAATPCAHHSTP